MPGFLEPVLWILFVTACVIVSVVILLQEGKGGGLGEAFGGVGAQAFGVKAEGIQKFTGWVSLSVVVIAILITLARSGSTIDLPEAATAPNIPMGLPPTGADVQDQGAAPAEPMPASEPAPAPAPAGEAPAGEQDGGG